MVELVLGSFAFCCQLGEGPRVRHGLCDRGGVVQVQRGNAHSRMENGSGALLQMNTVVGNEGNIPSQKPTTTALTQQWQKRMFYNSNLFYKWWGDQIVGEECIPLCGKLTNEIGDHN